jgi:hypothetical protein
MRKRCWVSPVARRHRADKKRDKLARGQLPWLSLEFGLLAINLLAHGFLTPADP